MYVVIMQAERDYEPICEEICYGPFWCMGDAADWARDRVAEGRRGVRVDTVEDPTLY